MTKGFLFRLLICVGFLSCFLYKYLDVQNQVTDLRIQVPHLTKEIRRIEEENALFRFQIEEFESPEHLMLLAQSPVYSHLKFPISNQVITLREAPLVNPNKETKQVGKRGKPTISFASSSATR